MTEDAIYADIIQSWSTDRVRQFPRERFEWVERTGSTNDDLLNRAREGGLEHGTLRVAEFQDTGRGRRGDKWEAWEGRNLLFSLALPLPEEPTIWTRLPHLVAFCLGTAIESVLASGEAIQCKWPNDLYAREKKLGGILVETVAVDDPVAVIGVGLNVNTRSNEWPEELRTIAISLYELQECESSRWFLLGLILEAFQDHFPAALSDFDPVLSWIGERDFLKGKRIRVTTSNGLEEGTAKGLGPGGELILESRVGVVESILSAERIELC